MTPDPLHQLKTERSLHFINLLPDVSVGQACLFTGGHQGLPLINILEQAGKPYQIDDSWILSVLAAKN